MAKCFFSGIEHPTEEMFILDITAARKAVQDLSRQISAIERLVQQLHGRDEAEVYNPKTKNKSTFMHFRMITPTIAQALSTGCSGAMLFITWREFKVRRREFYFKQKPPIVWDKNRESTSDISAESGGVS